MCSLNFLKRIWHYVVYERNPLVQILYVVLLTVSYYLFYLHGYPELPTENLPLYHKILVLVSVIVCSCMYGWLAFSDPGIITDTNIDTFKQYPSHPVLFPQGKCCQTCKTKKLARSKHCRLCNVCIARFDHHCIWINGCVGERNYRLFFMFLFTQFLVCCYGFYLTSNVFLAKATKLLLNMEEVDTASTQREQLTRAIHQSISTHQGLGFVMAECFMVMVILFFFMCIQLYRIKNNTTANERWKREGLESQAVMKEGQLVGLLNNGEYQMGLPGSRKKQNKKLLDCSWGGVFTPDAILNTKEEFCMEELYANPYDLQNFGKNFVDALSPAPVFVNEMTTRNWFLGSKKKL